MPKSTTWNPCIEALKRQHSVDSADLSMATVLLRALLASAAAVTALQGSASPRCVTKMSASSEVSRRGVGAFLAGGLPLLLGQEALALNPMIDKGKSCLLYTSPSPRDVEESRMPSSA